MQTKLPFFGVRKKEKNDAPSDTPITKERLKSVWDYLHRQGNEMTKNNFEGQYGKLPEKIHQINKDQALSLNMFIQEVTLKEDDVVVQYANGDSDVINGLNDKAIKALIPNTKVASIKNIDTMQQMKGEGLLKRYTELREGAFLMDYMDRYKDEGIFEELKRKKLMGEEETVEEPPPVTKHPAPPLLASTLKTLGLNGNTITAVKILQTNIPTYLVILVNGEGFYLKHYNEEDPFIAMIGHKKYDVSDLTGDKNLAKDAINLLLTKDQFGGLGGDEDTEDFGGEEEPAAEEPAEEQPTD